MRYKHFMRLALAFAFVVMAACSSPNTSTDASGLTSSSTTISPGSFSLSSSSYTADTTTGTVTFTVDRTDGSDGDVSVDYTVQVTSTGSGGPPATGTLSWSSGDSNPQTVAVLLTNQTTDLSNATFDLKLSNAKGGAKLKTPSSASVKGKNATTPAPTVTLTANPASVTTGGSTTLQWTTADATSCATSGTAWPGTWSDTAIASGSVATGALTTTGTLSYTLTCTGPGGSNSATATVVVSDPTSTTPAPTVTLTANPTAVTSGGTTTLSWTTTNATSCTTSGTGTWPGTWSNANIASGSVTTGTLTTTGTLNYVLTCTGAGGSSTATAAVTISAPPPTVTLAANPTSVVSGSTTTLSWTTTNATSCTTSGPWSGTWSNANIASGSKASTALTASSNTFVLTCTGAGGLATTKTVTVSVTQPTIAFANATYSVAPSAGSITLTVARTGSGVASTVNYATSQPGSTADFTAKSGTLSWAAGDTATKSFSVAINTAGVGGTSFTVTLSSATGATLTSPTTATVNITAVTTSANWSAEVWSAAYQSPAKLDTASLFSKSSTITASNGAVYYIRMNAWNSGASGFRYQKSWANNEHDWGVIANHVNDGQVKSYSSVVRGWASGEGFNGITNSGLGIQISALTKVHLRWAFNAPTDYGGLTGTGATNRVNVLWDTYFHTMPNPTGSDLPHTSLMINQYDVDGDGYYGGLAQQGQVVTLGGRQWRMYVGQSSWASGNTIQLFPGPFNDYKVMGTMDLTFDYLAVVNDLVSMGLIPATDYLTSIQAGYEVIAGATVQTTAFWTAIQSEADGATSSSGGTTPAPTVVLTAASTSLVSGNSTTLSWSTANATSCTPSTNWPGTWSNANVASGSVSTGTLTTAGSYNYTLTCTGAGGTAAATASIIVSSATTTPAPTVTLTASPTSLASGGSSTLTWSSTNATSCAASGSWSGAEATSGSQSTGALTASATYTLACTGAGGTNSASASISVGSGTVTPFTIYANGVLGTPNDYSYGTITINYKATDCAASGHTYGAKITMPSGGWQPAFDPQNNQLNNGWTKLRLDIQASAGSLFWIEWVSHGDVFDNPQLELTNYCTPNGQFVTCTIPFTDSFKNGVIPQYLYKFFLTPENNFNQSICVDNVYLE